MTFEPTLTTKPPIKSGSTLRLSSRLSVPATAWIFFKRSACWSSFNEDAEVADEDDDVFPEFVSIIDSFLGELPPDEVTAFTQSEGFEIYRQVASDPGSSSEEERSEFFSVVDSLLGGMPDDAVLEFTESDDFDVYRVIGAMYS